MYAAEATGAAIDRGRQRRAAGDRRGQGYGLFRSNAVRYGRQPAQQAEAAGGRRPIRVERNEAVGKGAVGKVVAALLHGRLL